MHSLQHKKTTIRHYKPWPHAASKLTYSICTSLLREILFPFIHGLIEKACLVRFLQVFCAYSFVCHISGTAFLMQNLTYLSECEVHGSAKPQNSRHGAKTRKQIPQSSGIVMKAIPCVVSLRW